VANKICLWEWGVAGKLEVEPITINKLLLFWTGTAWGTCKCSTKSADTDCGTFSFGFNGRFFSSNVSTGGWADFNWVKLQPVQNGYCPDNCRASPISLYYEDSIEVDIGGMKPKPSSGGLPGKFCDEQFVDPESGLFIHPKEWVRCMLRKGGWPTILTKLQDGIADKMCEYLSGLAKDAAGVSTLSWGCGEKNAFLKKTIDDANRSYRRRRILE